VLGAAALRRRGLPCDGMERSARSFPWRVPSRTRRAHVYMVLPAGDAVPTLHSPSPVVVARYSCFLVWDILCVA
jgi:hypothetical protein